MCSAPQKADKYRQICHPVPLFLPPSASFPGLGFVVQARHFGNCSGTEQAGIFISHLHLHRFLSWRGAGGRRGGDGASGASPAPGRPPLLPAGSLGSGSSPAFWRQAPWELGKDQPSWKSQLATIRPFPLPARCAFVWAAACGSPCL